MLWHRNVYIDFNVNANFLKVGCNVEKDAVCVRNDVEEEFHGILKEKENIQCTTERYNFKVIGILAGFHFDAVDISECDNMIVFWGIFVIVLLYCIVIVESIFIGFLL